MVDAVTHEMDERVVELIYDGLVEFRFLAGGNELDALSELVREIPNEALESGESRADRNHPDSHGIGAKLVGQAPELLVTD